MAICMFFKDLPSYPSVQGVSLNLELLMVAYLKQKLGTMIEMLHRWKRVGPFKAPNLLPHVLSV